MNVPFAIVLSLLATTPPHAWGPATGGETLEKRLAPPAGFVRAVVDSGSYAHWLRNLPLRPQGSAVYSYDGSVIDEQPVAVIDLDVGERDLQQCADSVIRLRAEYLWSQNRKDDIAFHFTSGDVAHYSRWAKGQRPKVRGRTVRWRKTAKPDDGRDAFGAYLQSVYMWAGTASLEAYNPRAEGDVQAGDFYVLGGYPGHAVLVLDVARHADGRSAILIGQGFMPAQSFHVVPPKAGGVWHILDDGRASVSIDAWAAPFPPSARHRFADPKAVRAKTARAKRAERR